MKFQVPQFIETETKIVGPLTWKQFIWVALGVGLLLAAFRILSGSALVLVSLVIIILSGSLAFLKVQEMPLIEYITKALNFAFGQKKYFFRKNSERRE